MGRRVSITVSGSAERRYAPARLAQWRDLSPRYARFYEALQQCVGVVALARGSRIGTHKVRAMLKGAKVLGFVTQDPLRVEHFLLNTLPPVQTLSVEKVRKLQALGVPLFHGNCEHDVAELRWLLSTLPRERDYDRAPAHPSRVWIPGRYEPSPEAGPVISHKGQHGPDCGACSWSREAQAEIEA